MQKISEQQSEISVLQTSKLSAHQTITDLHSELSRVENALLVAEDREQKLRHDNTVYQNEICSLRKKVGEMEEKHNTREDDLNRAQAALVASKSSAAEAEASLKSIIDRLIKENNSLRAQMEDDEERTNEMVRQNEALNTAKKEVKKWQIKCEEDAVEIRMLKMEIASVKKQAEEPETQPPLDNRNDSSMVGDANFSLINAFGAEGVSDGSEHFSQQTFVSKLRIQTLLKSPPGSSSRQLSYNKASNTQSSFENENLLELNAQDHVKKRHIKSSKCSLCFKDAAGVMKSCQCGKSDCHKRAHTACLAKYKVGSISSCISHPGTPNPPMPMILCDGIWKK